MIFRLEYTSGPGNSAFWKRGSPVGKIQAHLFTLYSYHCFIRFLRNLTRQVAIKLRKERSCSNNTQFYNIWNKLISQILLHNHCLTHKTKNGARWDWASINARALHLYVSVWKSHQTKQWLCTERYWQLINQMAIRDESTLLHFCGTDMRSSQSCLLAITNSSRLLQTLAYISSLSWLKMP